MKQMRLVPRGHQYRNIMPFKLLERYQSFGVHFCLRLQDNCREITSSWTLEFIYQITWCHQDSENTLSMLLYFLIFQFMHFNFWSRELTTVPENTTYCTTACRRVSSENNLNFSGLSKVHFHCTNKLYKHWNIWSPLCKPISYYSRFYMILNVPLF
jgi:hypothetical protein